MPEQGFLVLGIAAAAALASVTGGALSLIRPSRTLITSLGLGFASGVLFAAIALEMVPQAIGLSSIWVTVAGFVVGMGIVYGFDLFVHRGKLAGDRADEREEVERIHRKNRPRGGEVTVLGGGTSIEEVVEGLSIGIGLAIEPGTGIVLAVAIAINNISEGLSIGEMARLEAGEDAGRPVRRVITWTGFLGAAVFFSALAGWFLLRDLPEPALGFLFALGGGGMFYLTITDLIPEAAQRHYQQSAALSTAGGFVLIMIITQVV